MNGPSLSAELASIARRRGLYATVVAEMSGVSVMTARRILGGKTTKVENLEAVANALGYELCLRRKGE